MKHTNKARLSLVFIITIASMLQSACSKKQLDSEWDGVWQRRIFVPEGVQGRCIDESLHIAKKLWQLTAVVHSSYDCNQPFLELTYQGVLSEVQIKRHSNDKDLFLKIDDIQLVGLADLGAGGRKPLSAGVLKKLSAKYVPVNHKAFLQHVELSSDLMRMQGSIYRPLRDLAIPQYPDDSVPAMYMRKS